MIDECLIEFDFSEGLDDLELFICEKISLLVDSPAEVKEYIKKNENNIDDYPDEIAAIIE